MYDLISRKALLEELDKWINPCVNYDKSEFLSGIATAISEVETAPTVDAAPVVWADVIGFDGLYQISNFGECALPGFVDSKNEEKTERNAGYLVVSHSGGGMLRQGTRKGIRRTPANRGMRAHRIVKSLDISEDVCHGLCP